MGSSIRVIVLALVAVGIWFAGVFFNGMPVPRGLDAPPQEFSSARADATLGRLLGPEVPHPIASPANAAVRARIQQEFAALGVKTTVYTGTGCNSRPRYGFFACGTVHDVLGEVVPGAGKAIILVAHYDSVPAGPGASDDESGVATILETIRALKARGLKSQHPILAVITDGEEAGLLGAAAFVANPALKARVGVVVNAEARGNNGPSLLFQTSPGDGKLIDLYAHHVPGYATSSLFAVIYKLLPNDTDLTVFLNEGFTGFNFAFSGNVAHYHTPLDTRAHLDPSTLQMHGDNVLGVVLGLTQTDFATLQGSDAIYLTLLGKFIPRVPAGWALPLSLVALALLAAAAFLSRGEVLGIGRRLAALSIPLVMVVGAAAFGWLLHLIASLVSGQPDPSYATPVWLRIALGFGVLAVTIFASRLANARLAALSVWGWMAVLALVTAIFVTGLSPYFLFPALIGTILLLVQSRLSGAWSGTPGEIALFLAALLPLLIWLSLSSNAETVQGLVLHPLVTIPFAFAAMTLTPLLAARPLAHGTWLRLGGSAAAAALVFAAIAGLQPAYSASQPQRLNINFIDDHIAGHAEWTADTGALLPTPLRAAAPFGARPELATPFAQSLSYIAPAGALRFAVPAVTQSSAPAGAGRTVTLLLQASPDAARVIIDIPKSSGLLRASADGNVFTPSDKSLNPYGTIIACMTSDCAAKPIVLTFAGRQPVDIIVAEQHSGVPADGQKIIAARPNTATAQQSGDTTTIIGKVRLR
ncbi:MAG TPA: M20/M25/M40 family metallo-hydrolase [Rhizomicrobium sp.]|jgi:hypothetical protein|nr:M20/M25/M40 family metallo-hydrolase [Rhizomicrobium sp.]